MALLNLGIAEIWALMIVSSLIGIAGIYLSFRGRKRVGGAAVLIGVLGIAVSGGARYLSVINPSNAASVTSLALAILGTLVLMFVPETHHPRGYAGFGVLWGLWFGTTYFPQHTNAVIVAAVVVLVLLALGGRLRSIEEIVAHIPR